MAFHPTTARLWKHLSGEERLAAARAFCAEPSPEVAEMALRAIVSSRHMRPQAARRLAPDAQARILATVLDPGEPLAAALLVALHLAHRRPLLSAFLDALGLPHDNGVLKEEGTPSPVEAAAARQGIEALGTFPRPEVDVYLNTLWLQDPERWKALPEAAGV